MLGRGGRSRKAISVMFMTFIAISILTTVFLTMYLYLIRAQTLATDVERLYSEASNEDLKVYIDRLADGGNGEIIIENVGGIGVAVKYVVELDWSDKTAKLCNVDQFLPVNSSLVIKLSEVNKECDNPISPDGDLYILTERGNMFKAVRGGASFELEVSPRIATLESGGSLPVTLTLKAILLETPSDGRVLIIGDTSGCRMNETKVIIAGRNATTMTVVTSISQWLFWVIPYYGTLTAVASPTTTTIILEQRFIEEPNPITLTLSTRTTTTVTTLVTLTGRNITPWISGSECYVWFRVLNATSGSRLAEGGLQVIAGETTTT